MKRALVLTCTLVLALSALAWGDVDIHISGHGTGMIEITETLYTDFGQIFEYFYAEGDFDFYKDVYVWQGWDYGELWEFKYFEVDGFVDFYELVWVLEPYYGDFEMGAFTSVFGEGYVLFEKEVYAGFDGWWYEGYLDQWVYIEGYLEWGYVDTGHTATSFDWWCIDQYYDFALWTPTVNEFVYQYGFVDDGDWNSFYVSVWFDYEPFMIHSYIYDYAW